jgi:hypothetical protein
MEIHGNYTKQTYRNRCYIAAANGKLALNIPVVHTGTGKSVPYAQIQIDDSQPWASNHFKSIKSAYNSSPYFEYYEDDLKTLFKEVPQLLMDWNMKTLEFIIKQLQIKDLHIEETRSFQNDERATLLAQAKSKPLTPLPHYIQVFQEKHGFISPLSSLDILFNLGPASIAYLAQINP